MECNYSASHNRSIFVTDSLAKYVTYVPFCPEILMLGTPRETIRLVRYDSGAIRVIGNKTKNDYTQALESLSERFLSSEEAQNLSGYILKSKSPSCGMERVKLYNERGLPEFATTSGITAKMLKARYPLLPIEEEGRLEDAWLRENFIMQFFAYHDFSLCEREKSAKGLVDFHTRYKFLLQSKDEILYRECGRITANLKTIGLEESFALYGEHFKTAISKKTRIKPVVNVLQHMFGFLKKHLDTSEKRHIAEMVEQFQKRILPLVAILEVLKLYIEKYDVSYLKNQTFLSPYPKELALRSELKAYK